MIRLASGIVLLVLLVLAIWFLSQPYLLALAVAVLLLAFVEYAALAERLGAQIPKVATATATFATCVAVGMAPGALDAVLIAATIVAASLVLGSGRSGAAALVDVGASVFPVLYLGLAFGALVGVRGAFGRESLLLMMITIVVSDSGQYYTGRLFGRRPLAPAVSPKKTVEGAIGGAILGTAAFVAIGRWWLPGVPVGWAAGIGLMIVALGIAGDLFESLLKRSAGVKDSSALIPGHGGVLDRIDALLFAAPVYYVALRFLSPAAP
jgi:phosphatidate cytidylyltransferase